MTEHLPFGLRGARKPRVDAVQGAEVSQGGRAVGRAGKACAPSPVCSAGPNPGAQV